MHSPDVADPADGESQGFEPLRGALRSARRFVDALELVVDELEAQSRSRPAARPDDGARDDDFQIITISHTEAVS